VTFDDARAAVYTRLDAGMTATYPAVPVLYENRLTVDLAKQKSPFVACEIVYNDGSQASMELTPVVRYGGAIWLAVATKAGAGAKVGAGILGYLANRFKTITFSGVVCGAPVPMPGYTRDGAYWQTLRVPFHFDDIPA
jgi:hypothetical protein